MRCGNCRLIIPDSEAYCPFCQHRVETPEPADPASGPSGGDAAQEGAPVDPAEVPIPASDPEPPPVAPPPADEAEAPGEAEGLYQSPHTPPPPAAAEAPPPARPSPPQGRPALNYLAVAAAAVLAFKLGVFDNFLMIAGLKSPPAPPAPTTPADASATAPAEPGPPAEEAAPADAPAGPREPDRWQEAYQALEEPAKAAGAGTSGEQAADAPWAFEGLIYDILTLRPVPGVDVIFVGLSKSYPTRSDARGRYRVEVPPLEQGYTVVIEHRHYIEDYFPETSPPYRSLSPARRSQLRASIPKPLPWKGRPGEVLRRDAALFPLIPDR